MKKNLKTSAIIVLFLGLITIMYSCSKSDSATLSVLTTSAVASISETGAVSGGNITDDGGASVTSRGVCWGTATSPLASGSHTTDGTGTGTFTSTITGLTAGTPYYVRAYATNSAGTAYGNELSFTTTTNPLATLTTTAVTAITATTAVSGGDITDDNGSDITERGVCWGTAANPTITDPHTSDGTGIGVFTSNITGLTGGTLYYLRAYATNSAGTSYGNEVTFTSVAAPPVNEVWIESFAFNPATITVTAGTTIKWTNKDGVAHTVTSTTAIFDSGSIAGNGGTYSLQFNTPGTFPYLCTFHPSMTGTVIVQ